MDKGEPDGPLGVALKLGWVEIGPRSIPFGCICGASKISGKTGKMRSLFSCSGKKNRGKGKKKQDVFIILFFIEQL